MTGPEHYREAERLLNQAHHYTYGDGADPTVGAALAAEAQAHATLAVAAAAALPSTRMLAVAEYKAWAEVAAVKEGESA